MIHLEKVNYDNAWAICKLRPNKTQKHYVAPNVASLAEAYAFQQSDGKVLTYGIYNDKKLVGFVMIGYDLPLDDDETEEKYWFVRGSYIIWRFMIDKRYQGRGYGKEAFRQVLDLIRTEPFGKAEYAWLSYEPENEVAKKMYASFGFKEEPNGFDPEKGWDEMPAILKL